jgi:hypothetical protein
MGNSPHYVVVWSGGKERRGECAGLAGDLQRIGPRLDHHMERGAGSFAETEVGRLLSGFVNLGGLGVPTSGVKFGKPRDGR